MNNYANELKKRTFFCVESDEYFTGEEILNGFIEYEYPDAYGKPFCGTFTTDELEHLHDWVEYGALGKNGSLSEVASLEQAKEAYKNSVELSNRSAAFLPIDFLEVEEQYATVNFHFLRSAIPDYHGKPLYIVAVDGDVVESPYDMSSVRLVANLIEGFADEFAWREEPDHRIEVVIC